MKGTVQDFTWMEKAKCREENVDTTLFFPEKHDRAVREIMQRVRKLCHSCPVQADCLEYALEYEQLGFWGGMTEKERKAHRAAHEITFRSRVTG